MAIIIKRMTKSGRLFFFLNNVKNSGLSANTHLLHYLSYFRNSLKIVEIMLSGSQDLFLSIEWANSLVSGKPLEDDFYLSLVKKGLWKGDKDDWLN